MVHIEEDMNEKMLKPVNNEYQIKDWHSRKTREMFEMLKEHNVPYNFGEWEIDTLTFEKRPKSIQFEAVNDYLWFLLKWESHG